MNSGEARFEKLKQKLLAGERYRIVFLGDSLTAAEAVHPNWRELVEVVLKEELEALGTGPESWKMASWGIRAVNSGFDGAAAADLVSLFESEVAAFHPSLVIACVGKNDMHLKHTVDEHRHGVERLLQRLQEVPDAIFMPSTASSRASDNERYEPYYQAAMSAAQASPVQCVDLFGAMRKLDLNPFYTLISPGNDTVGMEPGTIDWLHPNQLGNAHIARMVLDQAFNISFNPDMYFEGVTRGIMYPDYR